MGVKTSKRYSSLKSLWNLFKLFLNFLISGPDKSTVFDFLKFLSFFYFSGICFVFINMEPYVSCQ